MRYDGVVDVDQLAQRFPSLWHVTFAGGWEGIGREGLLRVVDVAPDGCEDLRPRVTRVTTPLGAGITLRDQLRSRADPAPYLADVTPSEWWKLVNSRVYFFCRQPDVDKMVGSYLRRDLTQEVIKFRTKQVLEPVADWVEVTTVNAGVFPRTRVPSRGRSTFQPLAAYPAPRAPRSGR